MTVFLLTLSKHGSPNPAGTFLITHVTTPPTESFSFFTLSINLVMAVAVSVCGQRTVLWSTISRVMIGVVCSAKFAGACISPTELTHATICTPYRSSNHFSAIAPAATRPMVSRALARPPPELARTPYLH